MNLPDLSRQPMPAGADFSRTIETARDCTAFRDEAVTSERKVSALWWIVPTVAVWIIVGLAVM